MEFPVSFWLSLWFTARRGIIIELIQRKVIAEEINKLNAIVKSETGERFSITI